MTIRLTLVSPAMTAALREARFEADAPLDAAGLRAVRAARAARAAAGSLPAAGHALSGPSLRCRETAAELGLTARVEPGLTEWRLGRWHGRTLAEVSGAEPDAVSAWLTDPSAAPHGGETLRELCARVGAWLESLPPDSGRVVAVADAAVIRAALVHALGAGTEVFWRLDVAPLRGVELTGRGARWNARVGWGL
ncbi:histidine phosphatase family protein [Streptomyces sp. CAU 1734]|uniref:histidine phosphatase family protein n=1 Tax=Streptomyces sp. CAU 1734 TaxID=3140360 RepID=UPI003261138C